MKRVFITLLALILVSSIYAAVFPVHTDALSQPAGLEKAHGVQFHGMENLTYDDLLNYKPRELAEMTGQKFSLKERFALTLLQKKLKKAEKKGLSMEDAVKETNAFQMNWIAFLFGLFLPLIGALISWLIWGMDGLWSSLIGTGVALILIPILIAIF